MPLITCPDCSHQISDQAPACPSCGRPAAKAAAQARLQKRDEANRYNILSWALFGLTVISGLGGAYLLAGCAFIAAMTLSIIYHIKRP